MDEELTRYEALCLCRDRAGSDSQMARDLGVPQPKVWRWINQSKQLPAEYVLTAERLYGVPCYHLRPDIYPVEMLEASSRWSGVDHRAGVRSAGVDARSRRVSCNSAAGMKGASL
jgi:DNA-binding transcriptional regulator YdaS (Cro superfamily)